VTGRVWALAASVFLDALRRKVVWVVVLFAAVMAAAIPALPSYGFGVVEAVYREVALALTYLATMVLTLSLAANRIPAEIERRTVYGVLVRSVRRWEYLLGTWLGIFVTVGAAVFAFTVVDVVVGWLAYGELMFRLAEGTFAILLEAGVVAAFCVAVSSVIGPVVVVVSALAFVFLAHTRSQLLVPEDILWRLYPSLDALNIINPVAHGGGVSVGYIFSMLLVFVGWTGILLLVSTALFSRRDL